MRPGPRGETRPPRGEHEAPLQHVDRGHQDERPGHQRGGPPVEQPPERQHEEVEAEVAAEERVRLAERGRVDVLQHRGPGAGGAGPREERDHRDDRQEQAPDERLQDRASGQPELVLELPEHVRRGGARGHRQVGEEEDEDDGAEPEEEPAAERQARGEDRGEADLLEPEPVGVQRHGLADEAEQDEAEQQPEPQAGAPQGRDASAAPRRLLRHGSPGARAPCSAVSSAHRSRTWWQRGSGARSRRVRRQMPASSRRSLTRFVRSQVNSGSLRPKCP